MSTNASTSIVIMAAGMGSRYGGLKQLDGFGPNKETILEYSVYDAIKTGFDHIILIIRESFAEEFKEKFSNTFEDKVRVSYVYQELNPIVLGYDLVHRERPWGTGHAVLAAREHVSGPFAVINADDFYGFEGIQKIYSFLQKDCSKKTCGIVTYDLVNTLSEHGSVNRGICKISEEGTLEHLRDHLGIARQKTGEIIDKNGTVFEEKTPVSMSLFGFHQSFFEFLEKQFFEFLDNYQKDEKREFFITSGGIDLFVQKTENNCSVLRSTDRRYGVTNANDKDYVQEALMNMVGAGDYPKQLRS